MSAHTPGPWAVSFSELKLLAALQLIREESSVDDRDQYVALDALRRINAVARAAIAKAEGKSVELAD